MSVLIEAFPWLNICLDNNSDFDTNKTTEISGALESDSEDSDSGSDSNIGDEDDVSDQSNETEHIRSGAVSMAASHLATQLQKVGQESPSSVDTGSDEEYESTSPMQSRPLPQQLSLAPYALISELCRQSERTIMLRHAELRAIYEHGDWRTHRLVAQSHASIQPDEDDFDTRHAPLNIALDEKWNRLGLVEEGLYTFFLLLVFFGVYRLATIST